LKEKELNLVERRLKRFLHNPASVRGAMGVIVIATAIVVVAAGILMRLIDHKEYASIWTGMWWAVQTVTTVGYGDVTPKEPNGRIVATFVMFEGIAFLAIVTAAITSTFVERASRKRQEDLEAEEQRIDTRFDELDRRLERIEEALDRSLSK
jgi:voltage-gated potassium channel